MAKKSVPSLFDDLAEAFADYGTTVRGYVRYHIAHENLKQYLGLKSLQVLDVGGGSGGDAAWLVVQGHDVTFIEPSTEQRRFAERRFNFMLNDEERTRIHVVGKTLNDLPAASSKQYDLVMVHGVAMYQANPDTFIHEALQYVKPEGLVSLIEKGYYGTELRDIRDSNFNDLKRLHRTGRSINNLKQDVRTVKPEDVEVFLKNEGFEIIEWSGIRLITDDMTDPVEKVDPKKLKLILEAEYRHGHHPGMRAQGQLLHFIAKRI